jgi:hypothetical protein
MFEHPEWTTICCEEEYFDTVAIKACRERMTEAQAILQMEQGGSQDNPISL